MALRIFLAEQKRRRKPDVIERFVVDSDALHLLMIEYIVHSRAINCIEDTKARIEK